MFDVSLASGCASAVINLGNTNDQRILHLIGEEYCRLKLDNKDFARHDDYIGECYFTRTFMLVHSKKKLMAKLFKEHENFFMCLFFV